MSEEQRYRFVYCLLCRYDVEEEEGYEAAKHWDFCPRCGARLVKRPHPKKGCPGVKRNGKHD